MTTHTERAPIVSPAAWHANNLTDTSMWTIELTDDQRDELASVARAAAAGGRTIATLAIDDAPRPSLRETLGEVVRILAEAHGFVLLRRFPSDQLTADEVELAYFALGLHLGIPVSQDADGALLGHVRDERIERTGPEVRLYRTRQRQGFHADGADIIGLLCLHAARAGGESRLASYAVYNEILHRAPTSWRSSMNRCGGTATARKQPAPTRPFPWRSSTTWTTRRGSSTSAGTSATPNTTSGTSPHRPAASGARPHRDHCQRSGVPRRDGLPAGRRPTPQQRQDLHCREAYEDHEAPDERRHLLRLWLSAHDFASVEGQMRGGIPRRSR